MRKLLTAAVAAAAVAGLAAAPAQAAKPRQATITDTVVALSGAGGFDANGGDFDILREAVLATGLDGVLSNRRQLTVFAPTDQAFLELTDAATEAQAFAAVAGLGLDAVADVLAYHVSPGRRTAADIVPAQRVKTLQGGFLTKAAGSAILVDALGRPATIVAPDAALVSNGVIHVIDTVVLPFAP
jgi:uncharacterized surface protein with fasciclin (FAS1) repeats